MDESDDKAAAQIAASNGETPMPSGGPVGVGSEVAKPRKASAAKKPTKATKKAAKKK